MSNDLAALVKLDAAVEKNLDQLEQFSAIDLTSAERTGKFKDAFLAAIAMSRLRELLSGKAMEYVCALKNSRIGFLTDEAHRVAKGKGAYPPETIRDCVIEAVLRGARPIGNEFNLIAGNAYFTKEYFTRKLLEYPGMRDLKVIYGKPVFAPNSNMADIETVATWTLNGKAMSRKDTHQIRVNEGQGIDAVKGKAERKAKALIYWELTGTLHADGDVSESDAATPVQGSVVEVTSGGPTLDTKNATATEEPRKEAPKLPPPAVAAPATPPTQAEAAPEPAKKGRKKKEEAPTPVPEPAKQEAPPAEAPAPAPESVPVGSTTISADQPIKITLKPDQETTGETPQQKILRYARDIEQKADMSVEILSARANYCWANVGEDEDRKSLIERLGFKDAKDLVKNNTLQTRKGVVIAAASILQEKGLFK